MKVITLGTGGPIPSPDRHSACTVVRIGEETLVFDTGERIREPKELHAAILRMTNGSVYYHFLEALRRPPVGKDDFSAWLMSAVAMSGVPIAQPV